MHTIDVNYRQFLDKTNGFPKRDLRAFIAKVIFPLGKNGGASAKASVSRNHRFATRIEWPEPPHDHFMGRIVVSSIDIIEIIEDHLTGNLCP